MHKSTDSPCDGGQDVGQDGGQGGGERGKARFARGGQSSSFAVAGVKLSPLSGIWGGSCS